MKKTIKKRAFVSAIAMLIVSAIVLTSSTFAWFSMSKVATVDSMELNVSSPEGVQISANANAWTANLTSDDLFNAKSTSRYKAYENNINLLASTLVPVSSCFNYFTNGFPNFFKATLDDKKYATVTAVNQVAGAADSAGLVAFDLFFKVAQETRVYFYDKNNKAQGSTFTDTSTSGILTALRCAFVPMGTTQSSVAADAIALKNSDRSTCILFEPDGTNRCTELKEKGAGSGYVATNGIASTGAAGTVNDSFVLNNGATEAPRGIKVNETSSRTETSFVLPGGVSKVRVYIWVEGNDIDCQNSVAGSVLQVALKFTID